MERKRSWNKMDLTCDEWMEFKTNKRQCFSLEEFYDYVNEDFEVYSLNQLFSNFLFRNILKLIIDYLKPTNDELVIHNEFVENTRDLNSFIRSNQELDIYNKLTTFFRLAQVNKYTYEFIKNEYYHCFKFKINDANWCRWYFIAQEYALNFTSGSSRKPDQDGYIPHLLSDFISHTDYTRFWLSQTPKALDLNHTMPEFLHYDFNIFEFGESPLINFLTHAFIYISQHQLTFKDTNNFFVKSFRAFFNHDFEMKKNFADVIHVVIKLWDIFVDRTDRIIDMFIFLFQYVLPTILKSIAALEDLKKSLIRFGMQCFVLMLELYVQGAKTIVQGFENYTYFVDPLLVLKTCLGAKTSIHINKMNALLKYGAFVNSHFVSPAFRSLKVGTIEELITNGMYFTHSPTYKLLKSSMNVSRDYLMIAELDYYFCSLILYNNYSSLMMNFDPSIGSFEMDYTCPSLIRVPTAIDVPTRFLTLKKLALTYAEENEEEDPNLVLDMTKYLIEYVNWLEDYENEFFVSVQNYQLFKNRFAKCCISAIHHCYIKSRALTVDKDYIDHLFDYFCVYLDLKKAPLYLFLAIAETVMEKALFLLDFNFEDGWFQRIMIDGLIQILYLFKPLVDQTKCFEVFDHNSVDIPTTSFVQKLEVYNSKLLAMKHRSMFKCCRKTLKVTQEVNFKFIFECLGDFRDLINIVIKLPAFLVIRYPSKLDLQSAVVQPEY